jgi:hypothetical protein
MRVRRPAELDFVFLPARGLPSLNEVRAVRVPVMDKAGKRFAELVHHKHGPAGPVDAALALVRPEAEAF